jgi:hypothetical protein
MLAAYFHLATIDAYVLSSGGGNIAPYGEVPVLYNSSQAFTITAASRYQIAYIVVARLTVESAT